MRAKRVPTTVTAKKLNRAGELSSDLGVESRRIGRRECTVFAFSFVSQSFGLLVSTDTTIKKKEGQIWQGK